MLNPWHEPIDRPLSFSTTVEPVDLDLVKAHLRVTSDYEDDLITGSMSAARAIFEELTGRQLINADWELALSAAPCWNQIELPRPPLSGNVVITYDDANGDPQTFDDTNYTVITSGLSIGSPAVQTFDSHCQRGRIVLAPGASWPATNGQPGSFRITRTCGYGASPEAIPALIRSCLYLLVSHFHRNRSEVEGGVRQGFEVLPMGAQELMKGFAYRALPTLPDHHLWPHWRRGIIDPLIGAGPLGF
jgi:uncharacterized phiE125 gp8 family phage protein